MGDPHSYGQAWWGRAGSLQAYFTAYDARACDPCPPIAYVGSGLGSQGHGLGKVCGGVAHFVTHMQKQGTHVLITIVHSGQGISVCSAQGATQLPFQRMDRVGLPHNGHVTASNSDRQSIPCDRALCACGGCLGRRRGVTPNRHKQFRVCAQEQPPRIIHSRMSSITQAHGGL